MIETNWEPVSGRQWIGINQQKVLIAARRRDTKAHNYQRRCIVNRSESICGERRACSVNYGKRSAIYIHLQQTLICCTACLQAPSILGCSIDISGCSTIVSYINHPAEPLETILIGLWWW